MCGRFFLRAAGRDLAAAFDLPDAPLFERYNITPGQMVPIVLQDDAVRCLRLMRWGLIPSWAKDPAIGFRSINARSETVTEKPTFRTAFQRRHCLVPASGFYEWRTIHKQKLPTLFRPRSGLFALAGLWETWRDGATTLETFTVLTTVANALVAPTHDRMPVIINPADYATWLDATRSREGQLLQPYAAAEMTATAVDPWVNDARHEEARCLEALSTSNPEPNLFDTAEPDIAPTVIRRKGSRTRLGASSG